MKKIKLLTLSLILSVTTSCDLVISSPNGSSSNRSFIDTDIVRGPTGGSAGGGIIIVDNNFSRNAKYEVYFQEGFFNKKIDSGLLPNDGKINLSASELTSEMVNKIQNGSAKVVIEVLDGDKKSVASGQLVPESGSSPIDIG